MRLERRLDEIENAMYEIALRVFPELSERAREDAFVEVLFERLVASPSESGEFTEEQLEAASRRYRLRMALLRRRMPEGDEVDFAAVVVSALTSTSPEAQEVATR